MGAQVRDNEEASQPIEVAPGNVRAIPDWLRSAMVSLVAPLVVGSLSVYVTFKILETDVTRVRETVDNHEDRIQLAEQTLVDHNRRGFAMLDRVKVVETWQVDQGVRIREFYEKDWPKVALALERIAGVKEELARLSREIRRLKR